MRATAQPDGEDDADAHGKTAWHASCSMMTVPGVLPSSEVSLHVHKFCKRAIDGRERIGGDG